MHKVQNKTKQNKHSRDNGHIERTRNSKLKLWIFNCDRNIKLAQLSHKFCILSYCGNVLQKFDKYPSRGTEDIERKRISRLKLVTFNYELDLESARLSYGSAYRLAEANI